MDEKQEFRLRRKAIRMRLQGCTQQEILARVQRSRAWLSKWQKRFDQQGTSGLHSRSRRPAHPSTIYSPRMRQLIVQTRRRLVKQKIGLIGVRAIRRELRKVSGDTCLPSLSTIQRVLHQRGLLAKPSQPGRTYFPKPLHVVSGSLHALDWTCRYLEDGLKIYAFHTVNLHTRTLSQTIALDKRYETVRKHGIQTWKTLGIPQFLQLDNDAAFCGGYKAPRIFGQFVRLCLYLGIELIFLPVAQPEHNGEVEEFNGLWGGPAFWERHRFASVKQVERTSPTFIRWYLTDYTPPVLADLTPTQAHRHEGPRRLTASQIRNVPDPLPITAGRLHFIRKVKPDGTISLLNENWKVSKRLADKYVWATIITHCRRLEVWYQRSAHHDWHLRKTYVYPIPETVARLRPE